VGAAEYEAAINVAPKAIDMLNQLGGRELLLELGEKWLLSHQTVLARRAFELSGHSEGLARVAEEQLANGDSEMALSTFQVAGRRDRLIELADRWLQAHEDALAYRGYEFAGCSERLAAFQLQRHKNRCPECGGQGVVTSSRPFSASGNSDIDQANTTDCCPQCGGAGDVTTTTILYQGSRAS
jgi:hypothetical protein